MIMIEKFSLFAVAVSAAYLASCASPGEDAAGESRGVIPGVALVDNAEDGNTETITDSSGYKGYWYSYDDRTECDNATKTGKTWPVPESMMFPMSDYVEKTTPPADTGETFGTKAVRFTAQDHAVYGAGIGFNFRDGAQFDLTQEFKGVRFWVYTPLTDTELKVKIPHHPSDPKGGVCIPRDPTPCMPAQGCYDDPLVAITVTSTWTKHELMFDQFKPEGWGKYIEGAVEPTALDATTALQLQFQVTNTPAPGTDIWIDNVGLILKTP